MLDVTTQGKSHGSYYCFVSQLSFTIWCAAAVIRLAAMFVPHSLPHMNFVNILFVVYSLWVINMAVTGNYRKSA